MITPIRHIIAGSVLAFTSVASAAVLDEWTFSSGTPQVSDIQSKTMGNWDPALAGTSVPSAGLLRDATGGNSAGAFYGDNLGLIQTLDSVTITVDIDDIKHTERDYWFQFLGTTGGNMRGEINASGGGKIFFDVEGGGTALKDVATGYGSVFDVAEYTGAISLQVAFTWDFANNTLSYTVSGDGVGYTGTGSSAFSDTKTVAADLSGITNITQMRVVGNTVGGGEFIDLDTVRIEYTTPPPPVLLVLDEWTFTSETAPQVSDIQGKTMGNWDTTLAGTSVPSAGLLRDATGGNSSSAFYGDNLGLTEMPDSVTLTVDIADINHTERDYWFEFLGTAGIDPDLRLDINSFNGGVVIDLWGAGIKYWDGPSKIFDTDDYTGAISLTVSATWDFANNTLSYTMSGDGVGYTGTGSSSFSDTQTIAADLSGITNITQMRVRGNTVGAGEFIDLDTVRIEYTADSTGSPYSTWASGGELFTDDDNGDGVANGLAWILGASGPGVSALDKLPTVSNPSGFLQLDFTRENPYAPAKLYVEYGNDLVGWTKLELPASSGTIGGDIEVTVTAGPPDAVTVKIPTSHAEGGKLFGRLSATEN